ncbi:WD40-repeat-containing domain protein, partial [Butyriboletus roseoflavus]
VLDTGDSDRVWTVAFHPDGKHLLGGTNDGVQRWRLDDGQEVGRQRGMNMYAICVSMNGEWVVCGTAEGASVWDGEMHEKVIDVEDTKTVWAVDVSPDSTRFATGTDEDGVNIWSIANGRRLIGPLKHDDNHVTGICFSPTGELIATTCEGKSIVVFDSHSGDKLVTIETGIPELLGTPLAWSSDGQRIFAPTSDNKIRAFAVSTGSQLAESQILRNGNNDVPSIALAANDKFIVTFSGNSISFLDPLTLTRIGSVIEDSGQIQSIAISADCSYLATG